MSDSIESRMGSNSHDEYAALVSEMNAGSERVPVRHSFKRGANVQNSVIAPNEFGQTRMGSPNASAIDKSMLGVVMGADGVVHVDADIFDSPIMQEFASKMNLQQQEEEVARPVAVQESEDEAAEREFNLAAEKFTSVSSPIFAPSVPLKPEPKIAPLFQFGAVTHGDAHRPASPCVEPPRQAHHRDLAGHARPSEGCASASCPSRPPAGAKYCPDCGAAQLARFCTSCGARFSGAERFCPDCGTQR
jgi:hypothetical protein